jgi:hypothetical protein
LHGRGVTIAIAVAVIIVGAAPVETEEDETDAAGAEGGETDNLEIVYGFARFLESFLIYAQVVSNLASYEGLRWEG